MRYTKPALTIEQQADRLISRGLIADRTRLIEILTNVSYYRLSGYFFPHRDANRQDFLPGTSFDVVFDQYLFYRQLRVLVMDAIERIEVSVKAKLVNLLTLRFGPFAHTKPANFPSFRLDNYELWMDKIHQQTERSKEIFLQHYQAKYTSETEIPLWMMAEIMDFGTTLTLYRNCDQYDKRAIARAYGLTAKVLESWLVSLNIVRNICAHHGRLWNRILAVPPIVPERKHRPEFYAPRPIYGNRVFLLLCVLRYMLRTIAPQSGWSGRVEHAIKVKHPAIPVGWMGMPTGWVEYGVWR